DRAASLVVRRGAAVGVQLDGDAHVTGAGFVLADMEGEALAGLAGGEGINKRAQREWPRITSTVGRFVVSIVVRREGLPDVLGPEAFVVPGVRASSRLRPPIPLQRYPGGAPDEALLVAEILLSDRGALTTANAREVVLTTLAEELPFFDEHVLLVDS